MIRDGAISFEFTDSWVKGLTEQATTDYDYELDEGWMEEQLLDSPDAEVQTSESPNEAPVSPGTSHLFCCLLATYFAVYLHLYFILQLGSVRLRVLPRQLMYPLLPQSRRSRVTRQKVRSPLYLFLL
jgi:hypothetical protein